jgi:hypothetical protein
MKNDLISDNEVNDLFVNIKNLIDQFETWRHRFMHMNYFKKSAIKYCSDDRIIARKYELV